MPDPANVTPLPNVAATSVVMDLLTRELERIGHGLINLAIHDGKVVQFDVTEKRRLV